MDLELREAKAEGGWRVTCMLMALKAFQEGRSKGEGRGPGSGVRVEGKELAGDARREGNGAGGEDCRC